MTAAQPMFNAENVKQAIRTLHEPGSVFELRVLGVKLKGGYRTLNAVSGFFNSGDALVVALNRIEKATGIYVTLNPVEPALLNRAINRLDESATKDFAATDANIVRRRWLLIDCDPSRPKGISATDGELAKARNKANAIHAFLGERGWSQPVCALSGNGTHLLYRVDLPPDDGELLKRVLLALSQRFDDGDVEVDKAVHNPSRITKLYGTLACKGDHSTERPHRMSEIVKSPTEVGLVTQSQLEEVAALVPDAGTSIQRRSTLPAAPAAATSTPTATTATPTARRAAGWNAHAFVADFTAKHGIAVARVEDKGGDTYHMLELCPWSSEHGGADKPGDASIIVQADGRLGFKCFHSHCSQRQWRDFRLLHEPNFERRKQALASSIGQHGGEGRFAPRAVDASDDAGERDPESNDLRAAFFDITHRDGLKANERHALMADATVAVLHKRGRFFFHSDRKDFGSTMYFDGRRKLLLLVSSDEFQAWLSGFTGLNLSETAFGFVSSACKQEALAGGTTGIVPAAYWHGTPTAVYLSNGDGRMARITAGKVEEVDNGTDDVLFAAGQTLKTWRLGHPADPFGACSVFSDAATPPEGLELLRLWALSLPTAQRCKPPLVLTGEVGSGKTKVACSVFELYGISPRVVLLTDQGEEDFWTQLDGGGLVCFDNADTRIKWLADALQVAATDGSHEKRKLYTDGTIIRQHARAWVVLTSANPTFASDAGLADRLLVTRLERRTRETAEAKLSDELAMARNSGLSWIAMVLSKALDDRSPVQGGNLNRRHPDFASFGVRLGRAMGREGQAVAALRSAESDKSRFNLENDEVGSALLELGCWRGTAAELLEALSSSDSTFAGKWSTKRLGKRIAKLWTHLETVLAATKQTDGHSKQVIYSFGNPAGFAGFQNAIPKKSCRTLSQGDFLENSSPNPANSATTSVSIVMPSIVCCPSDPPHMETDHHVVSRRFGETEAEFEAAIMAGAPMYPPNTPLIVDGSPAFITLDDGFLMDTEIETEACTSEGRESAVTQQADETIRFGREEYETQFANQSQHEDTPEEAS